MSSPLSVLDKTDTPSDVVHLICRFEECHDDYARCGVPRIDRRIIGPATCEACKEHKYNGTHV